MHHPAPRRFALLPLAAAIAMTAAGCGDDDVDDASGSGGNSSTGGSGSGGSGTGAAGTGAMGSGGGGAGAGGGGQTCHQTPGPDDGARAVVIAHPYDENGNQVGNYEVLELGTDGVLLPTGETFAMGRAVFGEIVFSPDGQIGIAVHDDGSLGVFRISDQGIDIVHDHFAGSFYAERVWIPPSADHVLVLDPNWVENGGGIYRLGLACDGTLTDLGPITSSKLAHRAVPLDADAGEYLIASNTISGEPEGDTLHQVTLGDVPSHLASADAFGDDLAIVSSLALTANGRHALMGDNSGFSGLPNRVAVVALDQGGLSPIQIITPLEDPVDIVASPFDDRAIVISAFGDAIFELSYDANAAAPFAMLGEITYVGGGPQLPSDAVIIDRGSLAGRVLVTEVSGVRSLQFDVGSVTDVGFWDSGMGLERIVGAIGVQP